MVGNERAGLTLAPNYKWEVLGDDVVALDCEVGRVFRLSGASAAVAAWVLDGRDHGLSPEMRDETVSALASEGLLEATGTVSRRRVIGAAAALGVTVLMLPTAAAAASGGGGVGGTGSLYDSNTLNSDLLGSTYFTSVMSADEEVTLTINPVDLDNPLGTVYRIYQRVAPNGDFRLAWQGTNTTVTIGNLVNGTTYDFFVVLANGSYTGDQSEQLPGNPYYIAVPDAPTSLLASTAESSAGEAKLEWDIMDGATGYYVEFLKIGESTWNPLIPFQNPPDYFPQNVETYRITVPVQIGGTAQHGLVKFQIRAFNKRGTSAWVESNTVVVK